MRTRYCLSIAFASLFFFGSCKNDKKDIESTPQADTMSTQPHQSFGKTPEGAEVTEYTLKNKNGISISVINYGGIITRLIAPDRTGKLEDIVLGYDSLEGYLKDSPYFGAIVGRYGNRIANGKFTLDGTTYTLAQNNNGQHLHGGVKGFDKVFWNIEEAGSNKLILTYLSKDMEEGYPGNLTVAVTYELTDDNELKIDYSATTDKKTVVNITQHSYFNLTGNVKRDILDHQIEIYADKFVPVTQVLIPTGELKNVSETPFDFTKQTSIGSRINDKDQQLEFGKGYDHCWVLSEDKPVKHAARLYEPGSGRVVDVYTTEPGVQFYSGNFLDGSLTGKLGVVYKHRYGLCLETEHFPDSPNQKSFPSTELKPGETYHTQTTYKFSTK